MGWEVVEVCSAREWEGRREHITSEARGKAAGAWIEREAVWGWVL